MSEEIPLNKKRVMFNTPEQFVYPEEELKIAIQKLKDDRCLCISVGEKCFFCKSLNKHFGRELTN